MSKHMIVGECVTLNLSDPIAQPLLWELAQYHKAKDLEFSSALLANLEAHGYVHTENAFETSARLITRIHIEMKHGRDTGDDTLADNLRDEADAPWAKLNPYQCGAIDSLSAHLYDDEVTRSWERRFEALKTSTLEALKEAKEQLQRSVPRGNNSAATKKLYIVIGKVEVALGAWDEVGDQLLLPWEKKTLTQV